MFHPAIRNLQKHVSTFHMTAGIAHRKTSVGIPQSTVDNHAIDSSADMVGMTVASKQVVDDLMRKQAAVVKELLSGTEPTSAVRHPVHTLEKRIPWRYRGMWRPT